MKVILLAAGIGSRLRPITNTIPKCLVPINQKPLLDYWLDMVLNHPAVSEVIINLHYLSDKVKDHIKDNWQNSNITLFKEDELQGTAGTLRSLHQRIQGEQLLVVHADNLSRFSLNDFIYAHNNRPTDCKMTMMLFESDKPSNCGIVELDNQHRMIKMHEKIANPPGNLANGAVYVFQPEVLEWIQLNKATDISLDVIPAFEGQIYTWQNTDYHRDIGSPESYQQALRDFIL